MNKCYLLENKNAISLGLCQLNNFFKGTTIKQVMFTAETNMPL